MANEAPTTDAEAADARQQLFDERAGLRTQLADLGFGEAGGLAYDPNFADSSQVTAERGEAGALAQELSDALADVEAAIARIDSGTYGLCESCSQPIAPARLEAMPAARRCIACASRP
jgi:RNA polymerase-binding transcription factor DksA